MKKKLAVCAGLLLLGPTAAAVAQVQALYPGEAVLPPYEVMSIVRSTGLAPQTRPMRRGPYYVLVAIDRVGRQMRVVVDAQLGDIVNLRPAAVGTAYGNELAYPNAADGAPPPSVTAYPTGDSAFAPPPPPRRAASHADGGPAPTSPRLIPNLRSSNPVSTPLPRPRPHLVANETHAPAATTAPAADSDKIE